MSRVYDNWERLVGAVLNREELRQIALCPSFSSTSSINSSFDLLFDINPSSQHEVSVANSATGAIRRGVAARLFAAPAIALAWYRRRIPEINHFYDVQYAEEDPEAHLGQFKRFSLRELQVASDNFSNKNILGRDFHGGLFCHKCGEQFGKWEAVEEHHLSTHAVTEVIEGDSSRRIVEILCSNTENNKNNRVAIERILKVHDMQKMLAQFEEYRKLVKIKANKLAEKHPRCLADGNELLRFHGTTVKCSLGLKGSSSSLCTSNNCQVCSILRNGFSTKKELSNGIGVFTASTSSRALESIQESDDNGSTRKAIIMCRVIAGRVHRPLEIFQELVGKSGFDSLAAKIGLHSNIEELYLLSPRALLPCFVVIYKP